MAYASLLISLSSGSILPVVVEAAEQSTAVSTVSTTRPETTVTDISHQTTVASTTQTEYSTTSNSEGNIDNQEVKRVDEKVQAPLETVLENSLDVEKQFRVQDTSQEPYR
ncbi:hypothetical protein [Streptococcus ovis]|uniref:hypothetical protein n=1 Tax=Streptococcus ovis TaxID=82806 RepID=UPI00036C153E|nr:hypothetical protein [Streptococcus ovis]